MKSYHELPARHRQLLDSLAKRLLAASTSVQSLDPSSLIAAGSWAFGDGERLRWALRNRHAYGHCHYFHPKGKRAERRLNAMRWAVWTPIIEKAKADLINPLTVNSDAAWHPCPESMSDYFLEVLPPAYFRGGFACSEPYSHTSRGEEILLCFRKVDGKWHCRYATLAIAASTIPAAA